MEIQLLPLSFLPSEAEGEYIEREGKKKIGESEYSKQIYRNIMKNVFGISNLA